MKNKGLLICFTGIDGSGKTTISKKLVTSLNENGVKCRYAYAKLKPFISKPIIVVSGHLFLGKEDIHKNYFSHSKKKIETIQKHTILSDIYEKILLFDYLLQVIWKVKIPISLGNTIIIDRYIYDTMIIDLSIDLNYSMEKITDVIKNFYQIAPKPDLIFLIDLPEEVAFKRKNDIPNIEDLKRRRKIYLDISKQEKMIVIDGTQKIENLAGIVQHKTMEVILR